MEQLDCAVIGAGVVGLACARALAMSGRDVVILERALDIGTETSARNSEVIHAGIYYAPGSNKAQLCRAGKEMLYDYCATRGVSHERSGKLIVATADQQLGDLAAIAQTASKAGVADLQTLSSTKAIALEPSVACVGALLSPSTGLIDSHGLMLSYLGEAEAAGAMLALGSPVLGGHIDGNAIVLDVGGDTPMTLRTTTVINAAGLWAQDLSRRIAGVPEATIPECHYARGVYFTLPGKQPFSRPVYPVPEPGGLGCHYTLDLGGQGKFGPDVEWIEEIDYTVNPDRSERFYDAIRRYWPGLPTGVLQPGYAGVRPKLHGPGGPATDFVIQGPEAHGVAGLVNLYGIESPGLTSSLAIAQTVDRMISNAHMNVKRSRA